MSWIGERQRIWRTAILVLLVISFIGPWTGDRINVPEEYACSFPYLRTESDMCDMIGVVGVVSGVFRLAHASVNGTLAPTDLTQTLLFLGSYLLFLLLVLTTLLFILRPKRRHKLQLLAWGLAIIPIIFWGLIEAFPPSWMWGRRLYIGVAIVALLLELSAFVAGRRSGPEGMSRAGYR
jgi:hypothetical protein